VSQKYRCDCNCGKDGFRNRMTVVEAQERSISDAGATQRPFHRFLVLRECEGPFKRELEMMDSLRRLITLCEQRWFFMRWPHIWAVHSAHMAIHSRNLGRLEARKRSVKMLTLFATPAWLSDLFEQFWKWRARRKRRHG